VTIQKSIAKSFVEYFLTQFLRDLTKIRNETFKLSTIRHAFEKSEMWSINLKTCIKQLKIFSSDFDSQLSLLCHIDSQDLADIEHKLNQWESKIKRFMQ
jgi:hypothetical protein